MENKCRIEIGCGRKSVFVCEICRLPVCLVHAVYYVDIEARKIRHLCFKCAKKHYSKGVTKK